MFEWLFKHPQNDYQAGALSFASGWPTLWLLVAIVVVAVVLGLSLWTRTTRLSQPKLVTVWALQTLFAATLLVMLWQPTLDVQNLTPGQNTLSVLLDRSGSMHYRHNDQSRIEQAREVLAELSADLQENFNLTYATIGEELQAVSDLAAAHPVATQSNISSSLIEALEQARNEPLAAIVLATDGSDHSGLAANDNNADFWEQLQTYNTPIHTIGFGRELMPEDLEIVDVRMAEKTLPGAVEAASVTLRHGGSGTARIKVYDGDSIIAIEERPLPDSAGDVTFELDIDAPQSGLRELTFEVEPTDADLVPQNNARKRLLQVAEQQRRILYFEGEPRWEYKFIRRAVHDADGLALVTILRTTPNKFYRQGIDSPEQHADGFPISKEELYQYDALIIGNVEAISLNSAQHQLIHDFVAERGGTLLMLGGRNALADGSWFTSPVNRALPVAIPQSTTPTFSRIRARALLTPAGERSPITRLSDDSEENTTRWSELPEIADFQRTGRPKPGATVLLGVELPDGSYPLLTHQRYGNGNAYVLASSGTWRWQMQMPSEDQRHETFWQQLLQTMANAATQRFEVTTDSQIYMDSDEVTISARLFDKAFNPALNSEVTALLTAPDGSSQQVPLTADAGTAGAFSATIEAAATGSWRLDVSAVDVGDAQTTDSGSTDEAAAPAAQNRTHWIHREDGSAENFNLAQNVSYLKRLAASTGGTYRTAADAGALPDAIRNARDGIVSLQQLALWNIPFFFLLLLGLKLTEWLLRLMWGRL
jgi:uncharacterized membrane protein